MEKYMIYVNGKLRYEASTNNITETLKDIFKKTVTHTVDEKEKSVYVRLSVSDVLN